MSDDPNDYWGNVPAEEGSWWGAGDLPLEDIPITPTCSCSNKNLPNDTERVVCPLHRFNPNQFVFFKDSKDTDVYILKSVNYLRKTATIEQQNQITVVHLNAIDIVGNGLDRIIRQRSSK